MKSYLTPTRIAQGLRLYSLMSFAIVILTRLPEFIYNLQWDWHTDNPAIVSLLQFLIETVIKLFLLFGAAIALENIVRIRDILEEAFAREKVAE